MVKVRHQGYPALMVHAATLLAGRYVLDEPIGGGGYYQVWRATDTVLTRQVAVKLLHAGYASQGEALHTTGLIHRDIKPANILFTSGGSVRITDFGIAHAVGSTPVTSTGMVMGTPGPGTATDTATAPHGQRHHKKGHGNGNGNSQPATTPTLSRSSSERTADP